MSEMPRTELSPGARCVDCKCCAAELLADGDPICWACDANEPCEAKKRAAKAAQLAEQHPQPKETWQEDAGRIQEAIVGIKSTRVARTRISGEIREAILAADPSIPHAELARKYGISDVSVYTIRRAGGISVARDGAKPGKKPGVKHAKAAAANAIVRQAPEEILDATVSIHLRFTPEQLDSAWSGLSVASKAVAIAAALQAGI